MAGRRFICPRCGERSGIRIVYGMPDMELVEQANRGLVALGGCVIHPDIPDRRCLRDECGAEWRIPENRMIADRKQENPAGSDELVP